MNNKSRYFINPFYTNDEHFSVSNTLDICTDYVAMRFWREHFFKWNIEKKNYRVLPGGSSAEGHL